MIKVHFRKKTLLGYILYIPTVLNRAGSAFSTLADLRGIVLSVLVAGYFLWACYHLGTI